MVIETYDYFERIKHLPNVESSIDKVSDILRMNWWNVAEVYAYAVCNLKESPDNYGELSDLLDSYSYRLSETQIQDLCKFVYTEYMNHKYRYELSMSELDITLYRKFGFFNNATLNTFGRFGYDATNPIPVGGFGIAGMRLSKKVMTNTYLACLTTDDGLDLNWKRIGGVRVPNFACPIEEYRIEDVKGNDKGVFYLNEHRLHNSKECPEGFKFRTSFRRRGLWKYLWRFMPEIKIRK